jgi:2-aminoadipate transaminase
MAFSERVTRLKSSLIREILAAAQRPEVMSFAGGLPAEAMLPALDWTDMPTGISQYGMSEGEPALRELIAAQARALGVPCLASQVLVVSGSQQALDLAAKLYVDKGTEVLLEGPTYLAALQIFQLFGADCLSVPLTAEGVDLAALRSRLERHAPAFAYLIPTFQNPSGRRYSETVRDGVAALLDEFEVTLIEDEPYRDLNYDGVQARPIVSRLRKASWIYTGTFSKTLPAQICSRRCCGSSNRRTCTPIGLASGKRPNGWAPSAMPSIWQPCANSTKGGVMRCRSNCNGISLIWQIGKCPRVACSSG